MIHEVPVAVPVPVTSRSAAGRRGRSSRSYATAPIGRRSHCRQIHRRRLSLPAGRAPDPPRRAEPVYWGLGGKLRPDAWQTHAAKRQSRTPHPIAAVHSILLPDSTLARPRRPAASAHRVAFAIVHDARSLAIVNRRCAITRFSVRFRGGCMSPAPLRSPLSRFVFVVLLVLVATPGLKPVAQSRTQQRQQQKMDEVHREDQGIPAGPADHHRAGRSPSGVRHRPDAAQVPRPHRRHARRADLREGHPSLLRGARQGVRPRHDVDDRQDRRGPRHGAARGRRRGDDQAARQVQGHARLAHRSAQDDRGAGAAADSRPPSRSTGSRAACTRPRPAGRRCCWSWRTGSRSRRRRSSRQIRNNVITLITPVIEVDGREKQVDTYYFNKKRRRARRGCR